MRREKSRPERRTPVRPRRARSHLAPPIDSPSDDLPGLIHFVPDRFWGFRNPGTADHPGLCLSVDERQLSAALLKGTDAGHPRDPYEDYVVEPDEDNGLTKPTAFHLLPRRSRLRRLLLLHPDRYCGRIAADELEEIRRRTLHALDPREGH